ncbi:MAG: dTDP-4-amino-4,6-dideoxygalactose transaminase [Rhodocyclaceae bacterium]|nr:dTDP-4-amino-4,6-dideoxygalactose transaminase [Rhodocyclaceae bacterium]
MSSRIPFNKPFIAGKELYHIAQAVLNGHLSGDGHYTHRCAQWLCGYHGSQRALLTPSGTAALELAALLLDLSPGDEVIMPSFTFVTTASAFALRGATPVFVDIREDTFNLDERMVEAAITPRTRAIVAVHYGGCACEMTALREIADRHGLTLIEDAAHALGAHYQNRPLGSFGDLACLSFHETKNLISGEGGALLVNRADWSERAAILRQKGTDRERFLAGLIDKYTWIELGSSYVASELVAAFLWGQFEQAETITVRRLQLWENYRKLLSCGEEAGWYRLQHIPSHCRPNGHLFALVARFPEEREALLAYLKKNGISAVFHYVPLHASPAGRRLGRTGSRMDVTERISACLLRLPLFYELSTEDQKRVADTIIAWYQHERG